MSTQTQLPKEAMPLVVKKGPCFFDRHVEENRKSLTHGGPYFDSIQYPHDDPEDDRPRIICINCVLKGVPVSVELQKALNFLPVTTYDD
jgi:hypothetical protein